MLTTEERSWLKKAQKLLDQCPQRFGFYTIGDPQVMLYDRTKEHLFDDDGEFPAEVHKNDAFLDWLYFPHPVHSVRG